MCNDRKWFSGLMLVVFVAAFGQSLPASGQLVDNLVPDDHILTAEEERWLDYRFSPAERAVLDSTRNYAPAVIDEEAEFINVDGVTWSDYRGRVVVMYSWTSANSSGRNLPRRIESLLRGFSDEDVVKVSVHTPEAADQAPTFVERFRLRTPVVIDRTGTFLDEMGVYKKPVVTVIDRQGRVRYAGLNVANLKRAVQRLVDETFDESAASPEVMPKRDDRNIRVREFVAGADKSFRTRGGPAEEEDDSRRRRREVIGSVLPPLEGAEWVPAVPRDTGKIKIVLVFSGNSLSMTTLRQLMDISSRYSNAVELMGVTPLELDQVGALVNELPIRFPIASDTEKSYEDAWNIDNLPAAMLVGPDRVVDWKGNIGAVTLGRVRDYIEEEGLLHLLDSEEDQAGNVSVEDLPRWRDER